MLRQAGDHVRVRRPIYWHHGIFVRGDRVIEFGGGDLFRKSEALVRPVSLQQFQDGGHLQVVLHPTRTGHLMRLPGPLPRDQIVARAEWLAVNCPTRRYGLIGSNCKHVANWCVTGGYFESLQARRAIIGTAGVLTIVILAWHWFRLPPWAAGLFAALAVVGPYKYNMDPYRFWKGILDQWAGGSAG